jgi:hypothetical protein
MGCFGVRTHGFFILGLKAVLRAIGSGKRGVFQQCKQPPSAVLMRGLYFPKKTHGLRVGNHEKMKFKTGTPCTAWILCTFWIAVFAGK